MADGLNKVSDFEINRLELVTSGGNVVSLKNILIELSIYQDLYSSVMSGNMLVSDGHDLVTNFGMCGNDYIRISIDKPTLGKPIERLFRIYKITGRQPVGGASDMGQNYIIHFCSDELILSMSTLVSKSYKSMPYSSMVVDICENYLQIPQFNRNLIESTGGNYSIIIPNLRPFEAINFLASRSFKGTSNHCYFFFETRDGYQFKSLQNMFSTPIYTTYKLDMKQINPDPASNFNSINKFEILNDYDVITMMGNGGYAAKLLTINVINQSFQINTYNQEQRKNNNLLMNKHLPFNDALDRNSNRLVDNNDAFFRVATTFGENIEQYMMNRTLAMALINNFKISYSIPGDVLIQPGMTVSMHFPVFEYSGKSNKKFDERRDGSKFLVTAVRHLITADTHTTFLEMVQDSLLKPMPNAGAPSTLQKLRK